MIERYREVIEDLVPSQILANKPVVERSIDRFHIDLSNSNISALPEGLFEKLDLVSHINLSGNRLDHLPAGIFRSLINLESLDLSYNLLTNLSSDLLDNLENLTYLDLSSNILSELPHEIFHAATNLAHINLSANLLRIVPISLLTLHKLEYLDLRWNTDFILNSKSKDKEETRQFVNIMRIENDLDPLPQSL